MRMRRRAVAAVGTICVVMATLVVAASHASAVNVHASSRAVCPAPATGWARCHAFAVIDANGTPYQGRTGWFTVGGTSLAAPLIAAVYALAGNAASTSYPASIAYAQTSSLHDVTTGSNGSCGGTTMCKGAVGYDGPTGVGTPNGLNAF